MPDPSPNDHGVSPESVIPMADARRRWWESTLLVALVASLFLHILLFFVASLVGLRRPDPKGLGGGEAFMDLATMSDNQLTDFAPTPLQTSVMPVEPLPLEQRFDIQDLHSPFSDLSDVSEQLNRMEGLTGAGSVAAGSAGGDSLGLTGAGGEAKFFGVEARGSRFAFVVDVSGSMADEAKLNALKSALIASVEGLLEQAHFCVVLYSSNAQPLLSTSWARATDENKSQAAQNIAIIKASGATDPLPAMKIVFGLMPRPDAIYFMTDGVFTPETQAELPVLVEKLNREGDVRSPVHCITFVERGSEKLMRRIARQSSGSYTHVDTPRAIRK